MAEEQSAIDLMVDHSQVKNKVANFASRSEKTSWQRKRNNLTKFIEELINPSEQQILELNTQLRPLYDQVNEMRQEMIATCIHPFEELREEADGIRCTFCDKKFSIPNVTDND